MVRSLGAENFIDYTQEDFTRNGRRYDLVLNNVGNRALSELRRVMASQGRCVLAGAPKAIWAAFARILKALAWPPFLPRKFIFFVAKLRKDDLAVLCQLITTAKVTPVIDQCYPLSRTADAIA